MAVDGHPQGVMVMLVEVVDGEVDIRGIQIATPTITIVIQTVVEGIHAAVQDDPEVVLGQMNRRRRTVETRLLGTR